MGDQASIKKLVSLEEVQEHYKPYVLGEWGKEPSVSFLVGIVGDRYKALVMDALLTHGAAESFWVLREALRIRTKEYTTVFSFSANTNDESNLQRFLGMLNPLHFVHISKDQPGYIAYTPDATYGKQDRRLKTTPGRYLRKFHPELSDVDLQRLTDTYRHRYGVEDIKWALTAEDKVRVYVTGPHSCMAYSPTNVADWNQRMGAHIHPVNAYDVPWIKIAYLVRDGKINSRCVVYENPENPNDKRWVRSYGDEILRMKLEANGYTQGTLSGALLKKIPAQMVDGHILPATYVVPYIDDQTGRGAQFIAREEQGENKEFLKVIERSSTANVAVWSATQSNGLAGLNHNFYRHVKPRDFNIMRPDGTTYRNVRVTCSCCGKESASSDGWRRSEEPNNLGDICPDCVDNYVEAYYHPDYTCTLILKARCIEVNNQQYWILNEPGVLQRYKVGALDATLYPEQAEHPFFTDTVKDGANRIIHRADAVRDAFGQLWKCTLTTVFDYAGRILTEYRETTLMHYGVSEKRLSTDFNESLESTFKTIVMNNEPSARHGKLKEVFDEDYAKEYKCIEAWFDAYAAASPYATHSRNHDLLEAA